MKHLSAAQVYELWNWYNGN